MKDNGSHVKTAEKYKATTKSNHLLPVAPNLLEQNFEADVPDQKWVLDSTYIWTEEGWLYLAVVLELFSRRVVGWAMVERMTAVLVAMHLKWLYGGENCRKASSFILIVAVNIARQLSNAFRQTSVYL